MNFKIKKVVEIELNSLPDKLKDKLIKYENQYYISEIMPYDNEDWSNSLDIKNLQNYYSAQTENNNYKGSFDQFIADYNLEFEKYLIDEKMYIHLSGIKEIVLT